MSSTTDVFEDIDIFEGLQICLKFVRSFDEEVDLNNVCKVM